MRCTAVPSKSIVIKPITFSTVYQGVEAMFLARGLCYVIRIDTITIADPFYVKMAHTRIPLFLREKD